MVTVNVRYGGLGPGLVNGALSGTAAAVAANSSQSWTNSKAQLEE